MDFDIGWERSSQLSSQRDSRYRNRDLRYCPGVYLPTGQYNDVWLKCFLETTPYKTFKELFASGDVIFNFEKYEKRKKKNANKRAKKDM